MADSRAIIPSASPGERVGVGVVAAQRLQEWLKAAQDKAAQGRTVNFHLADSRCALDRSDGRGADETDLHPLYR
jgi:hypothetical protein